LYYNDLQFESRLFLDPAHNTTLKKPYKEVYMSKKVFVLVAAASLALTGIVAAEEMAAQKEAAAPAVVEQAAPTAVEAAKPAPVLVGNKNCPVCGMEISASDLGKNTAEYNGKVYNVCSEADKENFLADPSKYAKVAEDEVARPADVKADEAEGEAVGSKDMKAEADEEKADAPVQK
jgi:YHS domain-containing protein